VINFIRIIRFVRVIAVIIFVGQFKSFVLLLLVMESMARESLVLPLVNFVDCP
jgi:hypothetical protein